MSSPLWREFESGDAFPLRVLRFVIVVGGVLFLGFTGILELTWPQQLVLGTLTGAGRNLARSQLKLLRGHPDTDACVDVLDLSLRLLASTFRRLQVLPPSV